MNKQLYEFHKVLGYRFIPNLRTRVIHESGGYLLKTNNSGFRSDIDFVEKKDPGKKRILLFGDSFTAGDGVSNGKRFSDLLMKYRTDLEVLNFAIPGTGTDQHYLSYKEFAQDFECDMVVIVVFVENIKRVNSRYRAYFDENGARQIYGKPFFEVEDGKLKLGGVPVDPKPMSRIELDSEQAEHLYSGGSFHSLKKLITILGLKTLFQKFMKYDPLFEYKKPGSKEWQLLKSLLRNWSSEIDKPVLLVPMPLWQHVEGYLDFKPIEDRFMELHGVHGIHVFNPLPELRKYSPEDRRNFRFKIDVHFTPSGHEAYAKALLDPINRILK
jgi:carbamoyltransferase